MPQTLTVKSSSIFKKYTFTSHILRVHLLKFTWYVSILELGGAIQSKTKYTCHIFHQIVVFEILFNARGKSKKIDKVYLISTENR